MKTKNIFKTLAFAMLMPAMMLTTACSSDDSIINTPEKTENTTGKGYEIPITLNATRQDATTTRATYNSSTNKLEFSEGDKLFVGGLHNQAGSYSGILDWMGGITFSGTITTTNPYSGTAIDLLNGSEGCYALLLPAGYTDYQYLVPGKHNDMDVVFINWENAFATSKATAIEQFSQEKAFATMYQNGVFALAPQNAILNFTITGLTSSTSVNVKIKFPGSYFDDIEQSVTTDDSGTATFAIGANTQDSNKKDLSGYSLTVDGKEITLVTESKILEPGKIYNITRSATPDPDPTPAAGQFSVSATKKVTFSSGNLQATWDGTSWTWHFADNQWDYIGNAEGNTKVTNTTPFVSGYSGTSTTVDLFGWVGASSEFTGSAQYGITSSGNEEDYGTVYGEALKYDWGNTMGSGWRTLSSAEWTYLFNGRSASTVGGTSNGRYAKAKVNNVQGVILFPDTYTHPDGVTAPTGVNAVDATGWNGNNYSSADWTKMESAGCVFLPAAGYRYESTVDSAGSRGYYWSSSSLLTPDPNSNTKYAHMLYIHPYFFDPASESSYSPRSQGYSVRLVRDVE